MCVVEDVGTGAVAGEAKKGALAMGTLAALALAAPYAGTGPVARSWKGAA